MNENEAIEELQAMRDLAEFNISQGNARGLVYIPKDRLLVLDAAIKALNEIQQYRSIGTPEECRAAVEKQKVKAPTRNDRWMFVCQNCGAVWDGLYGVSNYCSNCGQRILRRGEND